jgi:hypothetical protein
MRFALLGDHPDGRAFARALAASGRHHVVAYRGSDPDSVREFAPSARVTNDLEELLADPNIQACVVAEPVTTRLDVTRRVLQSERHAAVIHPVDLKPDGAYELAMLQGDTHQALLPLITEHLGLDGSEALDRDTIFELTVGGRTVSIEHGTGRQNPALAGWTLLRRRGGELAEVTAFAEREEVDETKPLIVLGRFQTGGLFQVTYLPVPDDDDGDDTAAWSALAEEFDREVEFVSRVARAEPAAGGKERPGAKVSWLDEVRALELDDAAARSLSRRRSSLMEYQEASEEVGFKGTMTLVGCALLWGVVLLLVMAAWQPWLLWLVLPAILVFLALQLLRWVVPGGRPGGSAPGG